MVKNNRKICSNCNIEKSLNEFYSDLSKGKTQGHRHCVCKACQKEKRMKNER